MEVLKELQALSHRSSKPNQKQKIEYARLWTAYAANVGLTISALNELCEGYKFEPAKALVEYLDANPKDIDMVYKYAADAHSVSKRRSVASWLFYYLAQCLNEGRSAIAECAIHVVSFLKQGTYSGISTTLRKFFWTR